MRIVCGVLLFLIGFQSFSQTANSNQLQLEAAVKNLNKGSYKEALEGFNKLVNAGYVDKKIYAYRGTARFNLADYQGAAEDLDLARSEDNQSADFWRMLGISKYKLQEWSAAKYFLIKAEEAGAKDGKTYLYLGYLYYDEYHYQESFDALNKAFAAGEKELKLVEVRGKSSYFLGEYEQAIKDLAIVVKSNKSDLLTYELLGLAYAGEKKYTAAATTLHKADSLGSKNNKVYFQLGNCLYENKLYPQAIDAFTKAITLDLKDEKVYNQRGLAKLKAGHLGEASQDFDQAFKLKPDYPPTLRNRAQASYQLEDWAKVITDLTLADALGAAEKGDWILLSESRFRLKDYKGALEEVNKAEKAGVTEYNLDGKKHDLYFQKGKCLSSLHEFEPALKAFDKASANVENSSEFYLERARAFVGVRHMEKAISDLEKAQTIDGCDPNSSFGFYCH